MHLTDSIQSALVGAGAAIGVSGMGLLQKRVESRAKSKETTDSIQVTREGQLWARITQMEARFTAQEKDCHERITALETQVEALEKENDDLKHRIWELEHKA